MSALEILAVIAIIGFVIYQQLAGQALRFKRTVILPAILTVIGFTDLHSSSVHLQSADITCLVIGAAGSIAIGLAFGAITRLESRGGALWAQMPKRGLWLWGAMVAWRGVIFVLATGMHAHVAASTTTLLFTLGLNRLAQAAVIVPRAMAAGVPFAPEKDGKTFMTGSFQQHGPGATTPAWTTRLPQPSPVRPDSRQYQAGYDQGPVDLADYRPGYDSGRDQQWDYRNEPRRDGRSGGSRDLRDRRDRHNHDHHNHDRRNRRDQPFTPWEQP